MRRRIFFFLALLFSTIGSGPLLAQPWMEYVTTPKGPSNAPMTGEPVNFYEIQRAFERFSRKKGPRSRGWKQFRRWESFWEPRVYPSGDFPPPVARLQAVDSLKRRATKGPDLARWRSLGPSSVPSKGGGAGRVNCVAIHPGDPRILYVGTAAGGLWKSLDSGTSWRSLAHDWPTLGVSDIAIDPENPETVYAATGDADANDTYSIGVLKSTDGGRTWALTGLRWETQQTTVISRLRLDPRNSRVILAATNQGVWRSQDGGQSWAQVLGHPTRGARFVALEVQTLEDETVFYTAAWIENSSTLYRSLDGGLSWSAVTDGLPEPDTEPVGRVALAAPARDPGLVYALYCDTASKFHGVYRSDDWGASWILISHDADTGPNLLGWEADGSDYGQGQGWYDLALAVSPLDSNQLYVGGVNIWKSDDAGRSWSIVTHWMGDRGLPTVHADHHLLAFAPDGSSLYSCNDGGLFRSRDGGLTWEDRSGGLVITQLYRLSSSGARLIAGAQDNGTVLFKDGAWFRVIGGDGMDCLIDPQNPDVMYGCLYFGLLGKSVDGGETFTMELGPPSKQGEWVTPFALHPTDSRILYGGYDDLYVTYDGAGSWSVLAALAGATGSNLKYLAVAPSNGEVLYAGTEQHLLTNGGGSWTDVTADLPIDQAALSSVSIHPQNPRTAWVTFSGFSAGVKVFGTRDGGASWENVSGTLPNVPVNTLVCEKGTGVLYAGTDIGVFYRTPDMKDWATFMGMGDHRLPHVIIRELEISYPADGSESILRAASFGRGIWETPALPAADENEG